MKDGSKLITILLKVSEKAANIARVCRQNDKLFRMLVQEKSEEEKNPRFFRDFKTLADVLIQETIRHDVESEFPELAKMVKGEENNVFSNTLGETVIVQIQPTCEETTTLLATVMASDLETASLLATEVHRDIQLCEVPISAEPIDEYDIPIDQLGIWVDPIDSTADYINGIDAIDETTGLNLNGLPCVNILIGAYLKSTGLPIIGVVNQPFSSYANDKWNGICYWGIKYNEIQHCSINNEINNNKVIVLSRCEDEQIKSKLSNHGFTLVEAAGAGYKILNVALGRADAYILSKGSTFRWDSCGPHAILHSMNGGIVDFKKFLSSDNTDENPELIYDDSSSDLSNAGGLIAYRDFRILETLKAILQQ